MLGYLSNSAERRQQTCTTTIHSRRAHPRRVLDTAALNAYVPDYVGSKSHSELTWNHVVAVFTFFGLLMTALMSLCCWSHFQYIVERRRLEDTRKWTATDGPSGATYSIPSGATYSGMTVTIKSQIDGTEYTCTGTFNADKTKITWGDGDIWTTLTPYSPEALLLAPDEGVKDAAGNTIRCQGFEYTRSCGKPLEVGGKNPAVRVFIRESFMMCLCCWKAITGYGKKSSYPPHFASICCIKRTRYGRNKCTTPGHRNSKSGNRRRLVPGSSAARRLTERLLRAEEQFSR